MKLKLFILLIIILMPGVMGATIKGTVYSFDLEVQEAIVSINSSPNQMMVSKEGKYGFEVEKGNYRINASHYSDGELNGHVSENVKIKEDGSYNVDLILFPSFQEEEKMLEDLDKELIEEEKDNSLWIIILVCIGLLVIAVVFFKYKKDLDNVKKEIMEISEEEDGLKKEILEFIRENQGRVTQKEIRKRFPYSEAKMSLAITELEHEGRVERIKKGRGNVVVLKNRNA